MNTAVGFGAGFLITGDHNICIGDFVFGAAGNNTIRIGDAMQRSENTRKNSFLNYETAAIPAELRRRETKDGIPERLTQALLQRQHKCLANFAQCNSLGSFTQRGFETFDRLS
jgi:hypothetical protein